MATQDRPLSPHLGIYRWGWTMSLSILHRVTGVVLSCGLLLLTAWLAALAFDQVAFNTLLAFTGHWFGKLVLVGWSFAFFYHLCNGIRHLLWDTGWGFDLPTARRTAGVVITASILLSVLCWLFVAGLLGGAA